MLAELLATLEKTCHFNQMIIELIKSKKGKILSPSGTTAAILDEVTPSYSLVSSPPPASTS